MFAVVVTLQIKPDQMQAFMPLMLDNAAASRRDEPGCLQFDVCTDPARPNEVFLYETYTGADAFQTHLQTPHFKSFDAATAAMLEGKDVRTYESVAS